MMEGLAAFTTGSATLASITIGFRSGFGSGLGTLILGGSSLISSLGGSGGVVFGGVRGLVYLGRFGQVSLRRRGRSRGDDQNRFFVLVLFNHPPRRRSDVDHHNEDQPIDQHTGNKRGRRSLVFG